MTLDGSSIINIFRIETLKTIKNIKSYSDSKFFDRINGHTFTGTHPSKNNKHGKKTIL